MKNILTLLAILILVIGCKNDDNNNQPQPQLITKTQVIENYADLVYQSYLDTYNSALTLQTAINDFLDNPSESTFDTAKNAWLAAREPYGQTEAYRESKGPIDTDQSDTNPWGISNEGQMNAWPIDESYIDYVADGTEDYANDYESIISDETFLITEANLIEENEKEDDKSISTGWHAIEFLLWGQDNTDPSEDLPGLRPFTDYTTANFSTRRGEYLAVCTSLLLNDLQSLVNTWNLGGTYRNFLLNKNEDEALKDIITGPFFIAGDELSSERMIAPVNSTVGINNSGQEDEHSCFSDNTHRDIYANTKGVLNVIYGEFGSVEGPSFYDLVLQENPTQAQVLLAAANEALLKVNVIAENEQPFDYLITLESSTDSNFGPVMQAVQALELLGDEISASASLIGINLQ